MKNRKINTTDILTSIVCLIPVIAGIILYSKLPDTMAIHWGTDGAANGWASKFVAAIVLPAILLVVNLVFPLILKTDPKYENMDEKLKTLCHWLIPAISLLCAAITLAEGLGIATRSVIIAPFLLGLLFVIIGNYMPKTKQSYTMGIKLPWTLNSEENWNRTHRLAGFLWVVGGIVIIIAAIAGAGFPVTIAVLAVMVLVPTVYSYLLYRKGI